MSTAVLLITLLGVILLGAFLFTRDVLSPTVLFVFGYLFSVISAVLNAKSWHLLLSGEYVAIITIGVISFAAGAVFVRLVSGTSNMNTVRRLPEVHKLHRLNFTTNKLLVLILFDVVTFILFFIDMRSIAMTAGSDGSISSLMSYYRDATYTNGTSAASINIIVSQMGKVMTAAHYVCLYAFLNNRFVTPKKIDYLLLVPVLISILHFLFSAERMSLIITTIFVLFVVCVCYRRQHEWSLSETNILFARISVIAAAILFSLFFILKSFVGRTTNLNFLQYITSYSGGSVSLFNQYLTTGRISKLPGQETFAQLFSLLGKLGLIAPNVRNLEFRLLDVTGTTRTVGNVYSGMRRYFNDFGFAGIVLLPTVMGVIYTSFYQRLRNLSHFVSYHYAIIIYGYMLYAILLNAVDDVFYSEILTVGDFILGVFAYFVFLWLFYKKNIHSFEEDEK